MLNAFLDLLKTILCIERSSIMIDALNQGLVVPNQAETRNAASSDDAAAIGSDVRVWIFHGNLAGFCFLKHEFPQTILVS